MSVSSAKKNRLNNTHITFSMHPTFCEGLDRLVELDNRGSRAQLIETALRHFAQARGVVLPKRLAKKA